MAHCAQAVGTILLVQSTGTLTVKLVNIQQICLCTVKHMWFADSMGTQGKVPVLYAAWSQVRYVATGVV